MPCESFFACPACFGRGRRYALPLVLIHLSIFLLRLVLAKLCDVFSRPYIFTIVLVAYVVGFILILKAVRLSSFEKRTLTIPFAPPLPFPRLSPSASYRTAY